MALEGKITRYKMVEDTDAEMVEEVRTYIEDIPEDHKDYDKRGTTETIMVYPKTQVIDEDRTYDDAYLKIRACGFHQTPKVHHQTTGETEKTFYLNILYDIYRSKDHADYDSGNPVEFLDWSEMEPIDLDAEEFTSQNIMQYAYEVLNSQQEYLEMNAV
jgi:hypothetical protein